MSEDRVNVNFGATLTDVLDKLHQLSGHVQQSTKAMQEPFERLNGIVDRIKTPFIALAGVLAGGEIFEKTIEKTAETGVSLEVLSRKTGIAVSELSRLQFAANVSHVSAETLDVGLKKLARSMQSAETGTGTAADAFKAMDISVKDSEGHLRPMQDVLGDVAEKFAGYEDGAGKAALAMNLFGRSGADLIPLLDQGREGIADLKAESDRLGATWSAQEAGVAAEYEDSMKKLHASTSAYGRTLSVSLMPSLSALADSFTQVSANGSKTNIVTDVLVGTFRALATAIIGVKYTFEILWETAKFVLKAIGDSLGDIAAAVVMALHGNFSGAKEALKQLGHDIAADWDDAMGEMATSTQNAHDTIARIFGMGDDPAAKGEKGKKKKTAPEQGEKPKNSDEVARFQEEWLDIKDGSAAIADDLLGMERDFWTKKIDELDKNAKNYVANYRAIHRMIVAADRKLGEDQRRADMIAAQTRRDIQLEGLDAERATIEERRALRDIDANEAAKRLRDIADQEYQLRVDANNAEWLLADGDVQKQAQLDDQLAKLKQSHTKELSAITKATTLQITKDWDSAFSSITSAMRKSFDGVIQGTQTLRQALGGIFRNIALDFAAAKADELRHHVAVELAKRGITTETAMQKVAVETWAAIQSVAKSAWAAIIDIGNNARRAIAATWAAISAIPFVGPFLAPAMAIGAGAAVFALAGQVHSAAGGFDVPAGINPMTQLHAQEMVLPADLANRIRGMTGSGGGDTHHWHIHAWDSKDVKRTFMENRDALANAVGRAVKDGRGS